MTSVVLEEIPDRVSLAVDISNCRGNCVGCHSPFLKQDIGEELTPGVIDSLVADNFGVNCFLFLGEGQDPGTLLDLARYARGKGLEVALYSGREEVEPVFLGGFRLCKAGTLQARVRALEQSCHQPASLPCGEGPPERHHIPLLAQGTGTGAGCRVCRES